MLLPRTVHVSSTFKIESVFHDCLSADPQGNPPFSPFFGAPWISLPSAVHVSSIIKREASGDWEARYSVVFRIGSFAKYVYMYIIFVVLVCPHTCVYPPLLWTVIPKFRPGIIIWWYTTFDRPLQDTWRPWLHNEWSPEACQKSKGSRLAQSVKFRNVAEIEKRCFCAIGKFS